MNRLDFSLSHRHWLKTLPSLALLLLSHSFFAVSAAGQTCPPPPPANLILEGGFEICPVLPSVTQNHAINDNCAPPWAAANGTPSICNHTTNAGMSSIDAFEGVRFACISSTTDAANSCNHNEAFFQSVLLCPGVPYTLTFSYYNISFEPGTISVALTNGLTNVSSGSTGNPCFAPITSSQLLPPISVPNTSKGWKTISIPFTASSAANNQLVFWVNYAGTGAGNFDAGFDAISLTCSDSPLIPAISNQGTCPTYNFTGSTNNIPGVGVASWCWNFGDGTTGTGQQVSHTYAASGTYNVCLTIADNCGGCVETVCQSITCNIPPPMPDFTCPCTGSGSLNINATSNNPYYDQLLGGTLYSVLEAAFNYDQDNDGDIDMPEHHNCIAIAGKLILDRDVSILDCGHVQMQPCSEIIVRGVVGLTPARHATFKNNTISGCIQMWRSITVEPNAWLTFTNNTISDAQYANLVYPAGVNSLDPLFFPTRYDAQSNRFFRNHIGLYIPGSGGWFLGPNIWHTPFIDNEMACAGPGYTLASLFPACDAVDNYDAVNGYAGVAVLAGSFEVGVPGGAWNRFSNLRNGVIGQKVLLTVDRAQFNNMIGFNADPPSFSFSRGAGVAALGGWNTIRDSRFNTAGHGIHTSDDLLIVESNSMTKVRLGVESGNPALLSLTKNKDIGFLNFGIRASGLMNIPWLNSYLIDDNVLRTEGSHTEDEGFFAIDVFNGGNFTLANNNPRISRNLMFVNDLVSGLGISNLNAWSISDNHVEFNLPTNNTFLLSTGINLLNSHNNTLYGNGIVDNIGISGAGTNGFVVKSSIGNRFCCNSTFGNETGVNFWGSCTNTRFRLTTMDSHQRSLWLHGTPTSGYTVIGLQPEQTNPVKALTNRNRFETGSGFADNPAPTGIIEFSKFFVTDLTQPNYPPFVATQNATPNAWFQTNGATPYECSGDITCPAPMYPPQSPAPYQVPDGGIRGNDLAVANNTYGNIIGGASLQWEGALDLYARLRANPSLLGTYPTVDAFYASTHSGSPVKAFYEAEANAATIYQVPEAWGLSLKNEMDAVEVIEALAKAVLLSLPSAHSRADSLNIYWQSEAQRSQIHPHLTLIWEKERTIDSLRRARAIAALPAVLGLPQGDILQSNRKTALRVHLEVAASGATHLSASQFAAISPIAHQCPLSGGSAVYMARGLYQRNEQKNFDDIVLCNQVGARHSDAPVTNPSEVTIWPNPSDGKFQLHLPGITSEQKVTVQILDLSGRVLQVQDYLTLDGNIILDASKIASGLYVCRVSTSGHTFAAIKFAIVH